MNASLPLQEAPTPRAASSSLNPDHPWPGLQYFTTDDAAYFSGRDREIEEVCRLVRRHVHTVIFGISGLGKTSLLCAGVIPRLRKERYFPVYIRIRYGTPLSPAAQVRSALAAAIRDAGIDARLPAEEESLWAYFHRSDERFWKGVEMCMPVMIFDQFEELFTLGRDGPVAQEHARQLLGELECLIEGRPPAELASRFENDPQSLEDFDFDRQDFKVVWSLREDFLPDLEGLRNRFHVMGHNRFRIEPLSGQAALQAVLKPGGHLVAEEIASEIVRRVASLQKSGDVPSAESGPLADLKVDPALLSLMCFELNLARLGRSPRSNQIDAELVRNTSDRILAEFYQRSVAALPEAACVFIEERLLTGQGRFRQAAAEEDFLAVEGVTRDLLQRLVDGRLLRRDERFGTATLELSHDVLVGPVGEFRRQRRRRIEAAEAEQRRLKAEQELEDQRRELARRRSINRILAVASLFLLGALVFAVIQWKEARAQTRRAHESELHALAKEAEAATNLTLATVSAFRASVEKTNALNAAKVAEEAKAAALRARLVATESEQHAVENGRKAEEEARKATLARNEAIQQRLEADRQRTNAVQAARDRSRALLQSYLDSAVTLAHSGDFGAARAALDRGRPKPGEPENEERIPFQSSWNLMTWFVDLMSVIPVQSNRDAAAALRDVSVTPNGAALAVIGENGEALVYDLTARQLKRRLTAHTGIGRAVALDPAGKWLITAGDDQQVIRWSLDSGAIESRGRALAPVVALAADGGRIAVASSDGTVAVEQSVRQPEFNFMPLRGNLKHLTAVALAPGGRLLAATTSDGVIRLWELPGDASDRRAEARPLWSVTNRQARFRSVAFDAQGRYVASGGDDGIIHLHAVDNGALAHTLRGHRNRISALAFLPVTGPRGEQYLASAGWDRLVKLWDVSTGLLVRTMDGHSAAVTGLAAAGGTCFSVALDKSWREWRPLDHDPLELIPIRNARPTAIAVAPDATRFAVGTEDGRILSYPVETPGSRGEVAPLWTNSTMASVKRLGFQSDLTLISVDHAGRTGRWDPAGRAMAPTIPSGSGPLNAVAVRGPRDRFVTAGIGGGGSLAVTNNPDRLLHSRAPQGVVTLFSGPDWNPTPFAIHATNALSVDFGPGPDELTSAGEDTAERRVLRWSWKGTRMEAKPVRTGLSNEVYWAAVSPNGRWIAAGGYEGILSLIRVDGIAPPRLLLGNENSIVRIAFSPDSAHLFSVSTDGTLRAWETGENNQPPEPRELFAIRLPFTEEAAVPLWDFDFLGRDPSGNSWIAVPLTSGYAALYRLGAIYRMDSARKPD